MRAVGRCNDGGSDGRSSDCLPRELDELIRAVDALPDAYRTRMLSLCWGITEWSRGQHRLVQAAQEAVNQLQLDIKCLRFDLDMTRRERDAIRQDGSL
jgi:hypothetical protein